jgi:hypothetical protein
VAQWDYILPTSLTFADAAAPSGTLTAVLVAAGLAVLIVVPGFALLYVLDQKGLLPEEGISDVSDVAAPDSDGSGNGPVVTATRPRRTDQPRTKESPS